MEIERHLDAPCPARTLFAHVDDLSAYPVWMRLVHRVEPLPPTGHGHPAWDVELRAQLGPFARSKRLRMVRTVHEPFGRVVFERDELDGRDHAPWVLSVELHEETAADGGARARTRLTMLLHYGGGLWSGAVLERALDDEVRRGSEALLRLVSEPPRR
jgi:hypothetical protein